MSTVMDLPTAQIGVDTPKLYEIVNGEMEKKPMAGARHGGVNMRLAVPLGAFIYARQLGGIYSPDTTFTIGANDRMPDISFVAAARIPPAGEPEGKWDIAPDLAIEIVSPNDEIEAATAKIREYFAAGVRQVWQVSTKFRTVTIYHAPTQVTILTEDDILTCEELLPGFALPLRDIFVLSLPA
jgi:Uma2 family endonuclease